MAEPFIGEIRIFAFNFEPRGWFFCDGRLLSISQYSALFSLLGTYYGGNGQSTFALPDLRGRVPINQGAGPGLSTYAIGQSAGLEKVTLLVNNLPPHSHGLMATGTEADTDIPTDAALANARSNTYVKPDSNPALNTALKTGSIGSTGEGLMVENRQPYLSLNFCIAYLGIFPSRS